MLPNFVIIGAQKSASTFINKVLAEHPDIYIPLEEISIFEDKKLTGKRAEKYFDKLFCGRKEKLTGIKRPNYLGLTGCAERIGKIAPKAKLIVVLRNPVDGLVSGYYHQINGGHAPVMELDKGIDQLLAGKWRKKWPRTDDIVEFGFYHKHLSHYLKYFDRKDILILLHDDIKKNKLAEIRKVYDFLGVDASFVPREVLNENPQATIQSLPRLRFVRIRNFGGKIKSFGELGLFDKLIFGAVTLIDRLILSRIFLAKRPNQTIKTKLYKIYESDINKLEKLIDKNLSSWKVLNSE